MDKMTLVYTDGKVEKYLVRAKENVKDIRVKNFEDMVQDGLLKMIIDDQQIVIVPFSQIRKIIFQPTSGEHLRHDYPIFLHVTVDPNL
jgi:hypothetical protein